jgi:hypothetical protein
LKQKKKKKKEKEEDEKHEDQRQACPSLCWPNIHRVP